MKVYIEGLIPPTEAIVMAETWNGWTCPLFTKENADKVMSAWNAAWGDTTPDESKGSARFDEATQTYIFNNGDAEDEEPFPPVARKIDGQTMWAIGAFCWTWSVEVPITIEPRQAKSEVPADIDTLIAAYLRTGGKPAALAVARALLFALDGDAACVAANLVEEIECAP